MPSNAIVTVILEDLAGRRIEATAAVTARRFVVALPTPVGAFVFEATDERNARGYRIFRQAGAPIDQSAPHSTLEPGD